MENEFLPDVLPADPMDTAIRWFADARAGAVQPNPDAMVIASVGDDGKPSAKAMPEACFSCHSVVKDRDFVFSRYAP